MTTDSPTAPKKLLGKRRSGVLLHPTSLPGPHGIGDLGPSAYHFVDWLVGAGQRAWQLLPLNPIGPGNSPYASVSAFAGSPLMVALEPLVREGLLPSIPQHELAQFEGQNNYRVDFGKVIPWRMGKLRQAAGAFFARGQLDEYRAWVEKAGYWLEDYALFMALDAHYQQDAGAWARAKAAGVDYVDWTRWPDALARREDEALAAARREHAGELEFWRFVQFCFDRQWAALRRYANERDVVLIGDMPIFVAHHGADCWSRPDLYQLDEGFQPRVVAGVPPDFFSKTGQRWGNPLYDWKAMAGEGFAWWSDRMRRQLELADRVRVDHFRGFAGYWEIPAEAETAMSGRWVPGPGAPLFQAMKGALGELPVIAEDLGVITPDVEALRDGLGFPGMKILQFAFSDPSEAAADHPFLPHNYSCNCVVYTGTHDNDTARGWLAGASARERAFALNVLDCREDNFHWGMVHAALSSVAELAVVQMQDALGLGGEHRMNVPGQTECWTWRFVWDMVGGEPAWRLRRWAAAYGRVGIGKLELPG